MASYLNKCAYSGSIQLLVTHDLFRIPSLKTNRMFYVANVIVLSIVSELLWNFTLLIRYKLNIFQPPQMNQFDIRALLFGGYTRFRPLYKMVFNGYCKTLPSVILLMLHIALALFPLCSGI